MPAGASNARFPGLLRRLAAKVAPGGRARFAIAAALLSLWPALAVLSPTAAWAGNHPTSTNAQQPGQAQFRLSGKARSHPHSEPAPSYCRRGGPRLWAHLAACGWPGPAGTGPRLAQCPRHRLTPKGSGLDHAIVIRKANTVISCQRIRGMLHIEARNVTIRNSSITADSGKKGLAANGTAAIGAADGGFSWADPGYSQTTGDNFSIRDSYFHGFTHATANGHEDGYQTEGASHGLIAHNTYQVTASADSAIAIWDALRTARDVTVTGNLITGGGFAIYAEDYNPGDGTHGSKSPDGGFRVTGIRFVDNVFSTATSGYVGQFGVWFTRPAWPT